AFVRPASRVEALTTKPRRLRGDDLQNDDPGNGRPSSRRGLEGSETAPIVAFIPAKATCVTPEAA
ncbi:MAG: hypothetical protein AAB425_12220, partial [Bdellovibrionota bacterium]